MNFFNGPFDLKTPNARLIYSSFENPNIKWHSIIWQLEDLVRTNSQIQWANNNLYLYFFKKAADPGFWDSQFWVGREVVGFASNQLSEQFEVYDLYAGESVSYKLGKDVSFWNWNPGEIVKIERQLRNECDVLLDDTWRIVISNEENPEISFDFFRKL